MSPAASRHPGSLLHLALIGVLLGAPVASADRPLLADQAFGTGSAAFAGGGAGHSEGVGAVFSNPGALSIRSGNQMEAGMMGIQEGISPYALFGSRSGPFSYSLGYFYDGRIGPFRNGVVAGAAREILPGASLGAAVRSQGGAEGFGVDADAGLLLRPRGWAFIGDWAVLGLAARNLAESGIGQEPEGYRTLRSYALSMGARREAAKVLFLPLRQPDASYEVRAEGLSPGRMSHIFSAGAGFTPTGALGLRASLRLPHEGTATVGLGGSLDLAVGAGTLRFAYAFTTSGKAAGLGAPSQSFSVNLALRGTTDRQAPWVTVRADRVFLDSGANRDRVHFRLKAADRASSAGGPPDGTDFPAEGADPEAEAKAPGEAYAGGRGELREWSLGIFALERDGRKGPPVRTFQGKDLPPRLIRWDGKDEGGSALAPGFYAFRLRALDKAGNVGETPWQLVEVGSQTALSGPAQPSEGLPADQEQGTRERGIVDTAPADSVRDPGIILEGKDD